METDGRHRIFRLNPLSETTINKAMNAEWQMEDQPWPPGYHNRYAY
jgi:hypothetical protein